MELNLTYSSPINFGEEDDDKLPLMVTGMSCRAGFIENKMFIIPKTELHNIAESLSKGIDNHGAYILKDHGYTSMFSSKSVDKLVGRIVEGTVSGNTVLYKGRIEDEDMAHKIRKKLVTASSVGLYVNELYCSICGREYGNVECRHFIGDQYPDEGLHDIAKDYLDDMGGKVYAAIVGKNMEAREQSIVLFPAIEGATIGAGLNFSEDTQKLFDDIEKKKKAVITADAILATGLLPATNPAYIAEGVIAQAKEDKLTVLETQIASIEKKLSEKIKGFNKDFILNTIRESMTDEDYTQKIADLQSSVTNLENTLKDAKSDKDALESEKTKLETKVTELQSNIDTANDIIKKYKDEATKRLEKERKGLVKEASDLRESLELPERDYSEVTIDLVRNDLELLKDIPVKAKGKGEVAKDPSLAEDLKEDIRELIFKTRKSGDKKGLRSLPKVD